MGLVIHLLLKMKQTNKYPKKKLFRKKKEKRLQNSRREVLKHKTDTQKPEHAPNSVILRQKRKKKLKRMS